MCQSQSGVSRGRVTGAGSSTSDGFEPGKVSHMAKALIRMQHKASSLLRREDGATAVEYGLMVALIAVVIIVAVVALGTKLSSLFTDVSGQI